MTRVMRSGVPTRSELRKPEAPRKDHCLDLEGAGPGFFTAAREEICAPGRPEDPRGVPCSSLGVCSAARRLANFVDDRGNLAAMRSVSVGFWPRMGRGAMGD